MMWYLVGVALALAVCLLVYRKRSDAVKRQRELLRAKYLRTLPPSPGAVSRARPAPPRRPRPPQRKPANPNIPRVQCDVCKRTISLTKAGAIREHGGHATGLGYNSGSCRGSGKKYVEYVIHEEPV